VNSQNTKTHKHRKHNKNLQVKISESLFSAATKRLGIFGDLPVVKEGLPDDGRGDEADRGALRKLLKRRRGPIDSQKL
jgi:hypothetical protein